MKSSTDLESKSRSQDQLRAALTRELSSGRWPVGATLPSTRELARQYEASFNAVLQALHQLQDDGLVELRPRSGVIVRNTKPPKQRTSQRTFVGVLGSVTPRTEPGQWWGSMIYHAVHEEVTRAGYDTLLLGHSLPDGSIDHATLLSKLESRKEEMAGLIISFTDPDIDKILVELDRMEIPWVTANQTSETCFQNFVSADNVRDSRRVGQLFSCLGITNSLVLHNGMEVAGSTVEKVNGFVNGYMVEGQPLDGIKLLDCGGVDRSLGYRQVQQFLTDNPKYRPQGIFAIGDHLALGAIDACQALGLSVPNDVKVVGTTGLEISEHATPPLTVLAQPMDEIGRELVRLLMEMSREEVSRMTGRRIPCKFIPRASLQAPQELLAELGLG